MAEETTPRPRIARGKRRDQYTRIPIFSLRLVRERTVACPEPGVGCEAQAARILHALLDAADREKLVVICVNGRNIPVAIEIAAVGGLHGCSVEPRDLLKVVLLSNASAFLLGHNHPGGDPVPSREDIALTASVKKAAEALGTPLLDHVIVAPNGRHASFSELGLL